MLQPTRNNASKAQTSSGASVQAPVGGWDAVSPLADMKPDRAIVLDNWFPVPGDVRVRRGSRIRVAGMGTGPVESLMVYNGASPSTSKMFAATGGTVYDASSTGIASATSVTGQSNNRWQYTNFTTSAAKYLFICNGVNDPYYYDGSSWAHPTLSTSTFGKNTIVNVNAHQNRLWFVFKDSTMAGYLPTGVVAGTVVDFQLGGHFTKGGYLVAMGTWTKDSGAGADDLAVFISSRGQCAVYQGTDPSSSTTWGLVGVFDVGPPIGYRCFTKVGGDLALVNLDGVLPLSTGLQTDRGATATVTITARINNAMNDAARSYKDNFGWEFTPYAKGTMAILNVPLSQNELQHQYVMNTLTGAWCRFKGMNANCWVVFNDKLFFGTNDGHVAEADTGGLDIDTPIDAIGQGAYNYYNSRGTLKQWKLIQPLLTTDTDARPALGLSTDYKDNASLGTPSSAATASALYDEAVWDRDIYAVEGRAVSEWTGASGFGQCASIHFRATTGPETGVSLWDVAEWDNDVWSADLTGDVEMRMNGFNVIYERGAFF